MDHERSKELDWEDNGLQCDRCLVEQPWFSRQCLEKVQLRLCSNRYQATKMWRMKVTKVWTDRSCTSIHLADVGFVILFPTNLGSTWQDSGLIQMMKGMRTCSIACDAQDCL